MERVALQEVTSWEQSAYLESQVPRDQLQFTPYIGGDLYPRYAFCGKVELKGITYFDARKIYIAKDSYYELRQIISDARKITKTCDTHQGRSYYHFVTSYHTYEVILDHGCCEIIQE